MKNNKWVVGGVLVLISTIVLASTSFGFNTNGNPFNHRWSSNTHQGGFVDPTWSNSDNPRVSTRSNSNSLSGSEMNKSRHGGQGEYRKNHNPSSTTHAAPITSTFSIGDITTTGAVVSASTDQPGQAYFVLLPTGSVAPTPAQIRAWQDASGATALLNDNGPSIAGLDQFPVYNLSPGASYTLYFIVESHIGKLLSATPQSASFTTDRKSVV